MNWRASSAHRGSFRARCRVRGVLGRRRASRGARRRTIATLCASMGIAPEAQKCYESLDRRARSVSARRGILGMELYQEANNQFRIAADASPTNAMIRVRWGRLMHERFNNTEADNLFNEALERDPKNAQAYYGLALVSADGFDSKADRIYEQGHRARSEIVRSARTDGQSAARRFRRSKSLRRSGRGAENFSRGARCHGHPRGHRSPRRPLARRVARTKFARSIPPTAKGTRSSRIIWF